MAGAALRGRRAAVLDIELASTVAPLAIAVAMPTMASLGQLTRGGHGRRVGLQRSKNWTKMTLERAPGRAIDSAIRSSSGVGRSYREGAGCSQRRGARSASTAARPAWYAETNRTGTVGAARRTVVHRHDGRRTSSFLGDAAPQLQLRKEKVFLRSRVRPASSCSSAMWSC